MSSSVDSWERRCGLDHTGASSVHKSYKGPTEFHESHRSPGMGSPLRDPTPAYGALSYPTLPQPPSTTPGRTGIGRRHGPENGSGPVRTTDGTRVRATSADMAGRRWYGRHCGRSGSGRPPAPRTAPSTVPRAHAERRTPDADHPESPTRPVHGLHFRRPWYGNAVRTTHPSFPLRFPPGFRPVPPRFHRGSLPVPSRPLRAVAGRDLSHSVPRPVLHPVTRPPPGARIPADAYGRTDGAGTTGSPGTGPERTGRNSLANSASERPC